MDGRVEPGHDSRRGEMMEILLVRAGTFGINWSKPGLEFLMRRVVYTCLFGHSELFNDFEYQRDGGESVGNACTAERDYGDYAERRGQFEQTGDDGFCAKRAGFHGDVGDRSDGGQCGRVTAKLGEQDDAVGSGESGEPGFYEQGELQHWNG